MNHGLRIIGLDVAYVNMGIVSCHYDLETGDLTLTSCSTATTDHRKTAITYDTEELLRRGRLMHDQLQPVMEEVEPDVVMVEAMSFPRINPTIAIKMAIGWGAIAPLIRAPLIPTSPQDLKAFVAGARDASKKQVELGASLLMPDPDQTRQTVKRCVRLASLREHCWDALGAVLAGLQTPAFQELAARRRQQLSLQSKES